jgi:thiol-disulfide isomerase/thioredoxin
MKFLPLPMVLALAAAALPVGLHAQSPSPSPAAAASPAGANSPAAAAADLSQYKTADALWAKIEQIQKGPAVQPKSEEEAQAAMEVIVTQLNAACGKFVESFPDDPRHWQARLLQLQVQAAIDERAGHANPEKLTADLRELASHADAPEPVRQQARMILLSQMVNGYVTGNGSATSATVSAEIDQFAKDFPSFTSMDGLKMQIAQGVSEKDPALHDKLIKEVAAGTGKAAELAKKQLALKDALKKPLDLHFTAVDGTKVVLIDFWATWCGPCVGEVPDVVATYKKLHDKGFEIVGISLDQDKEALTKFLPEHEMTWPQYFDGKGWQNEISSGFGIESIPAMWLVNKKGIVATMEGREDLEGQVLKLLAE